MTPEERQELHALLNELRAQADRIKTLELTLWGVDQRNGLRGDLKEIKQQLGQMARGYWFAIAIGPIAGGLIWLLKTLNFF